MPDTADAVGNAGTAFGGISLTLQLLEGCKAGFSLWRETAGLGEEAVSFITRLRFEAEAQLNRWMVGWDIDKGADSPFFTNQRYHHDQDAALNYINLVYDRLYRLQNLEKDDPTLSAATNLPVTAAASTYHVADLQRPDARERQNLVTKMTTVQSGSTMAQRLNWAMDNKARAQERLDEVVKMINILFGVFPPPNDDPHAQVALSRALPANVAASVAAATNDLVVGLRYIKDAIAANQRRTSKPAGTTVPDIKTRQMDPASKVPDPRSMRACGKFTYSPSQGGATVDVLVEWKAINSDKAIKAGYGQFYKQVLEERILNIARLMRSQSSKPTELRTLDCLGVAQRKGQTSATQDDYGLVYRMPSATCLTLLQLLEKNLDKSLDDRVKIAVVVSKALLFLHLAGWLHKGVRSDNILFFPDKNGEFHSSQPYLAGFEYSRESGANHPT